MSVTLASPPRPAGERLRGRTPSLWRTPRTRSLLVLCVLAAVGGTIALAAGLFTDLLWFEEVGQRDVFLTMLRWKVLTAGITGLGAATFVLVNLLVVGRVVARHGARPPRFGVWLWRGRLLVVPAVVLLVAAVAMERHGGSHWRILALWTHRNAFGVDDPLFHRDVGFFVYSLPLGLWAERWLMETAFAASGASTAAYAVSGLLRRPLRRGVRVHLLVLVALICMLAAWKLRLDQFALALPHGEGVAGATYTDVHVLLPALRVLSLLAVAGTAMALYAAVRPPPRAWLVAAALVAAAGAGARSELPSIVHRFVVAPQVLARERDHVATAISFTRRAYGLDRLRVQDATGAVDVSEPALTREADTIANVPLWDPRVVRPSLEDLQSIGRYYDFPSVTVDRYRSPRGRQQLVTVGAREVAEHRLGRRDRGWTNEHFGYTHGYGVVAVHAAAVDRERYPRFAKHAFAGHDSLGLREPRLYFGELHRNAAPYAVVPSNRAEVDVPASGDRGPRYHYTGDAGIGLSNPVQRIAFAARFGDLNLLLSSTVGADSRILLHRDVRERLRTIAPFLDWEAAPRTIVAGGRVQFVFTGYTSSATYPYSAPTDMGERRINYVRAAAVGTVDAFSGDVAIYAAPERDPILRAWKSAFPGLILPAARMPREVRDHLAYPRLLFAVQSRVLATYHALDTTAFWTGADTWNRARQLAGPIERVGRVRETDRDAASMRANYLLARLPGDSTPRFMLTTAYTPRGRQNLIAYLAGSVGSDGALELRLLSLPRDRLMLGPTQASRRILASAGVGRRLDLVNRESTDLGKAAVSRTQLGVPRVVPIGGGLVHVQPVFLTAGGGGVPRLQLVTAYAGGRVGYGASVLSALRRMRDEAP